VALYEAALAHLRVQGALVNAVKPELLLEGPDFDRLSEARGAAAAGDAAAEEALEAAWGDMEARFDELAARAWSTVLLQVRVGEGRPPSGPLQALLLIQARACWFCKISWSAVSLLAGALPFTLIWL
jgi:hypothetical protein